MHLIVFFLLISATIAIIFFLQKNKFGISLLSILILALILRNFAASDNQLHQWDEKYHALISKNIWQHPLKPTLIENPVFAYDPNNWVGNHVWLSKPPATFWVMGLSINLFGNTIWAVRLPSIIFGLLSVYLTFLIGKKLFTTKVGLIAAYIHGIHGYLIELGAGKISSDHVDTLFLFLVEMDVFIIIVYPSIKQKWLATFLISLMTGFAFLTKWYPAFILLPLFGLMLVNTQEKFIVKFLKLAFCTVSSIIISVSWIIYIQSNYPLEASIANKVLNAFNTVVENHQDSWYYYFIELMTSLNEFIYVAIFSLIFIYLNFKKQKTELYFLLFWIAIPLLVFSLSDTKRFTYLFICAPAVFILVAHFIASIKELKIFSQSTKLIYGIQLIFLLLLLRLNIERLKYFNHNTAVSFEKKNASFLSAINSKTIIFNTDDYIDFLFFTNAHCAYKFIPDEAIQQNLIASGYNILILP